MASLVYSASSGQLEKPCLENQKQRKNKQSKAIQRVDSIIENVNEINVQGGRI